MQQRSLYAVEMCSVVFRVLSSSRSALFCILSSHTIWFVPLAEYENVNVICGYVFWQERQLCLAGDIKVKVQFVPERMHALQTQRQGFIYEGINHALCTIDNVNINVPLIHSVEVKQR